MKKFISLMFIAAIAASTALAQQQELRVGDPSPAFTGTTLSGNNVDVASLRGRVTVVTFWSTRCEICRYEIPKLNTLAAKFDRSKVAFVAFSTEDDAKIKRYLTSFPFDFEIVPNSFGTLLQFADRDRSGNVNIGYPAFFVLDAAGRIQHRSSGFSKTSAVEATVSKLIAH
jgi:peroxiredoxin